MGCGMWDVGCDDDHVHEHPPRDSGPVHKRAREELVGGRLRGQGGRIHDEVQPLEVQSITTGAQGAVLCFLFRNDFNMDLYKLGKHDLHFCAIGVLQLKKLPCS